MIRGELLNKFYDWVKNGDGELENRGLLDDAPQEAKEAYKIYKKLMGLLKTSRKDAKAQRVS